MAKKNYSLEMQLKAMGTQELDALIKKLEQLDKLKDELKNTKIDIDAETTSGFKNAVKELEKIPDEKKIKITANSDMQRSLDNMNREIIQANNRLQQSLSTNIGKMMSSANKIIQSSTSSLNNSIGKLSTTTASAASKLNGKLNGTIKTQSTGLKGGELTNTLLGGNLLTNLLGGSKLKTVGQSIKGSLLQGLTGVGQKIGNMVSTVGKAFASIKLPKIDTQKIAAGLLNAGRNFSNAFKGVKSVMQRITGTAQTGFQKVKSTIQSIKLPKINSDTVRQKLTSAKNWVSQKASNAENKLLSGSFGNTKLGSAAFAYKMNNPDKVVLPMVIKDQATAKIKSIVKFAKESLLGGYMLTISAKDKASEVVKKVLNWGKQVTNKVYEFFISVKDKATPIIKKVTKPLATFAKGTYKATMTAVNKAAPVIKAVTSAAKTFAKGAWKATLWVVDKATKVVKAVGSVLKGLVKGAWKVTVTVLDKASSIIKGIGSKLASLAKTATTITIGAAAAGGALAIKEASTQEQNTVAMQHFIERFNNMEAGSGAEATQKYVEQLVNLANKTPFETGDIMTGGKRAIQIAGGDVAEAQRLTELSANVAAMNPSKTVSDAMEMLADLKLGETARAVEFGFKWNQEDIEAAGGADEFFKKVTSEGGELFDLYNGGAAKLATTFSGLWSTITGKAKSAFAALGAPITEALKGPMEAFINGPLENFLKKAPKIGESIASGLNKVGNVGKKVFDNLFKSSKPENGERIEGRDDNYEPTSFERLQEAAGKLKETLSGLFSKVGLGEGTIVEVLTKVGNKIMDVATVILNFANDIIPKIVPVFQEIASKAAPIFANMCNRIKPMFESLGEVVEAVMPVIGTAIELLMPIIEALQAVAAWAFPMIAQIIADVAPVVNSILESMKPFFNAVKEAVLWVMQAVEEAWPIISDVISVAADIINPILQLIGDLAMVIVDIFKVAWPPIKDFVQEVWDGIKPAFQWIADFLQKIADGVRGVIDWFKKLPQTITNVKESVGDWWGTTKLNPGNWFSHATGLPEVPYDGYKAELHKGETVLTANQKQILDYKLSSDAFSSEKKGTTNVNPIISVNVNVDGGDPNAIVAKIKNSIESELVGVFNNLVMG